MDLQPITREGREKLMKELDRLKYEEMPKVEEAIGEAMAHGDVTDNSDFRAAIEARGLLEAKIRQLVDRLARSYIVDTSKIPRDVVAFASKVTVKDLDTGDEEVFEIVGEGETDVLENKIAVNAPVAQGLLSHKVGDKVEISVPRGILKFEILNITV